MSVDGRFDRSHRSAEAVRDLMAMLLQEEKICDMLLGLSTQERQAVLENRVQLLEQLGGEKSNLIEKLGTLESKRQEVSGRVASGVGLPATATLLDLASRLGDPDATDLEKVRERIIDLAGRLQRSNDSNLLFMRKSLDLVRDSIRQLRRSMGSGAYGADGNLVIGAQPAFSASVAVDRRA